MRVDRIQLAVHTACEVLMRDLIRNNANPSPEAVHRAAATEQNLEQLLTFETDLMVHFPVRRKYRKPGGMRGHHAKRSTFRLELSKGSRYTGGDRQIRNNMSFIIGIFARLIPHHSPVLRCTTCIHPSLPNPAPHMIFLQKHPHL